MCGFVAAMLRDAWLRNPQLEASLAAIEHRGPDALNTWFSSDGRTALGHVRLSIIGLDNGDQPISAQSHDVHIVVNGEIYGYQQQRAALAQTGHQFSTDSDSEVALQLYLKHGTSFASELRGEFAM